MNNVNKSSKIVSIQALRALAFLGIFLCHAGATVSWPAFGVSVFFVLSGYLMYFLWVVVWENGTTKI